MDANYVTSKIFGDKNVEIGGSFTGSYTSGENNKDNLAYNAYFSYPNDLVEYDLSVMRVQNEYNPEMGYLRRENYKLLSTELQFNPRPKFISWIQQAEIKPIELNYYLTDDTDQLETVSIEVRPLGLYTKSGEFIEFNLIRIFDRLDEPFEIVEDIEINKGKYWYDRYEVQVETFSGRKIAGECQVTWGDFYTGERTELECYIEWNLNEHLNIGADWQRNIINLAEGDFITDETGGKIEYSFNTKMNTSLFGQWNNEDNEIVLNYRFNWLPKIGSDFYFVINQVLSTDNNILTIIKTTILTKFIWRFAI